MVTIVMTTYSPPEGNPRFTYAKRCLAALYQYLESPCSVNLILADDGSGLEYFPALDELIREWDRGTAQFVTGPHNGIGASLNRALAALAPDEPWVYTTDDWLLNDMLSLELPLWLLEAGYDLVRLGPIHPNLMCETKFTAGHGWWLDLKINGHSGFTFATRPFLAAPSMVRKLGLFNEGFNAYETERLYAGRCHSRDDLSFAAINLAGPWDHIGEFEVGDRDVGPATLP